MDQKAYRHVPYDVEIEQALLGSILVDNRALDRLGGRLTAAHFYDPLHGRIYDVMVEMAQRGGVVVTPLTLHANMKSDPGVLDIAKQMGHTQAYFDALKNAAPAMPNIRDYTNILIELGIRRGIIRVAEDMSNAAYEAPLDKPARQQLEEAEKELYALSDQGRFGDGPMTFGQALQKTVEGATRAQARGGRISGVATGFTDIDNLLGGLQPSDLLILAGRPGMGKTALGTNMAFHAARTWLRETDAGAEFPNGAAVLFFSLEMAAQQLSARILSEQTEIEMWKIRNGRLTDKEWEQFVLTMQELQTMPLFIDDTGGISIAQIAARARRLKREKNIGLIVIDYLQLVAPSRQHENRVQEITEVTKGLKTLAKELDIPVLALSQLSRGVDAREDKRPVLSDLRESGSIEQDADVVMFVYREEYYLASREPEAGTQEHAKWLEKLERATNRAEVLVEKHRHGATRSLDLIFEAAYTRFSNPHTEAK